LGFQVKNEVYREERQSFKLDLSLNGHYLIELFSFPNPPNRLSRPESTGLRHIAFGVHNIEESCLFLKDNQIDTEDIRIDEYTGRKFTFFSDPDNLPIELYEI
jgi:glyoxylase I family protein